MRVFTDKQIDKILGELLHISHVCEAMSTRKDGKIVVPLAKVVADSKSIVEAVKAVTQEILHGEEVTLQVKKHE